MSVVLFRPLRGKKVKDGRRRVSFPETRRKVKLEVSSFSLPSKNLPSHIFAKYLSSFVFTATMSFRFEWRPTTQINWKKVDRRNDLNSVLNYREISSRPVALKFRCIQRLIINISIVKKTMRSMFWNSFVTLCFIDELNPSKFPIDRQVSDLSFRMPQLSENRVGETHRVDSVLERTLKPLLDSTFGFRKRLKISWERFDMKSSCSNFNEIFNSRKKRSLSVW